jgi:hypothetical protein
MDEETTPAEAADEVVEELDAKIETEIENLKRMIEEEIETGQEVNKEVIPPIVGHSEDDLKRIIREVLGEFEIKTEEEHHEEPPGEDHKGEEHHEEETQEEPKIDIQAAPEAPREKLKGWHKIWKG